MRFYVAKRTQICSPHYLYFNSIEEINQTYDIDSTIDDYNRGYTFEYEGESYLLGYE